MFGALRFAEGGSSVLLLKVVVPLKIGITMCVTFWRHRKLNPSNVVYGEGGGKLLQMARFIHESVTESWAGYFVGW